MSTLAVEFSKTKAVAAFLVTELGAVAIFFVDNARVSGYIALAVSILTALAVYQFPNTAALVAPAEVIAAAAGRHETPPTP